MTGVVVATHGEFGKALLGTLGTILGVPEGFRAVSLEAQEGLEEFLAKVTAALDQVDPGKKGAVLLVDLFGGTPFNVGLRLAQERPLQVVTGINLAMLIQAASRWEDLDPPALAQEVQKSAREGILTSQEIIKK
ncbi:MAG TPA: PTS sugar transporter subunit IIA [bacterium]|nr:PTS sugar transporter subunit IIA [bacterium]